MCVLVDRRGLQEGLECQLSFEASVVIPKMPMFGSVSATPPPLLIHFLLDHLSTFS